MEWVPLGALIAFLFAGLYFSYSQSSFVALFCVAFAIAFLAAGRRLRIFLLVCAAVATLGAAAYAALNPQKFVPALETDDGALLTQSLAIVEYLDEVHPQPPLFGRVDQKQSAERPKCLAA